MDFEDVVLLGSVRQDIRSPPRRANLKPAGIRNCIQAWRNGEPWVIPTPVRSGPPANGASRPSTISPPRPPLPPGPQRNPLSPEAVPEEVGTWEQPWPSDFQTPLAAFPEDEDQAPIEDIPPPGSFFVSDPDEGQDAPAPPSGFFGTPHTSSGSPIISSERRCKRCGKGGCKGRCRR